MEHQTEEAARSGPWIMNPSGNRWYPFDPRPQDFDIRDIAHCLARQNRFNGAALYSVASHSILCAYIAESGLIPFGLGRTLVLTALLHDAPEAVIGDMVRPLKMEMPQFRAVEDNIWKAISRRFHLPDSIPEVIEIIDRQMAAAEASVIFEHAPPENRWWETSERDHLPPTIKDLIKNRIGADPARVTHDFLFLYDKIRA